MLARLRDARRTDKGFTLTELLIVVVVLGVLAGIVVFAVNAFDDTGRAAACESNKRSVEVAVEAYYADNGSYPTQISALVPTYLRETPPTGDGYTITLGAGGAVSADC